MSNQPKFQKIETVTSGYFPYILGRFSPDDLPAIGVMDMDDPAVWSGGESSLVYYFLITPEELAWRESEPEKLDALASVLQQKMPRSRFYSATSSKPITPTAVKEKLDKALKAEPLEEDGAFDAWKKTIPVHRTVRMPATPLNKARQALYEFQRTFKPKEATPEELEQEEKLEKALGELIFHADELYVACDLCYQNRFPLIDPVRGDVYLFTTKELADIAVDHYAQSHLFYANVKKLEKDEIKPFLRSCENLGVLRFRVDEGIGPATVWRRNIIPNLEGGFAASHGASLRGLMLRTLQISKLLQIHGAEMNPRWKSELEHWCMTWNRALLQDMGNSTLYVPCLMPDDLREQFKDDYLYSQQGLERTHNLMKKANAIGTPVAHPKFTGKLQIMSTKDGRFPIRALKLHNNKTGVDQSWLLAFSTREEAVKFVTDNNHPDAVVGLSLDELNAQATNYNGVLVDLPSLSLSLVHHALEQALSTRDEKRIIYRPKPAAPDTAAPAQAEPTAPEVPAVESVDTVSEDITADTREQTDAEAPAEKKAGFFSRFFKS